MMVERMELKRKRKIILLGKATTGKTSIKQLIFEGKDPINLLTNPLEPTRGINSQVYSWLDLNLGIFDTSGQELSTLINNVKEQNKLFQNTDALIYIIDYTRWIKDHNIIYNEILEIKNLLNLISTDTNIFVFFHKIDLIPKGQEEEIEKQLNKEIKYKLGLMYYLTSLHPQLSYSLYNAFYKIVSSFSQETHHLKIIIDDMIKDLPKSMCFVTNNNNSIVVQTMTSNFNPRLLNYSHNLAVQLTKSFEQITDHDKLEHVIISSVNNLNIIMKYLQITQYDLKNIILISQSLSANRLILLIGKIKLIFNQYVFHGSYNLKINNEIEEIQ